METVSPVLKLARNCHTKMNIFFKKTGNLIINWLPLFDTHTNLKVMKGNFGYQPVCRKSSFIRPCCFNSDQCYLWSLLSIVPFISPKYSAGPSLSDVLVIITHCDESNRLAFETEGFLKFRNKFLRNSKKSPQYGWKKCWDLLFWND